MAASPTRMPSAGMIVIHMPRGSFTARYGLSTVPFLTRREWKYGRGGNLFLSEDSVELWAARLGLTKSSVEFAWLVEARYDPEDLIAVLLHPNDIVVEAGDIRSTARDRIGKAER